jgi:hypothetical protein
MVEGTLSGAEIGALIRLACSPNVRSLWKLRT